MVTKNKTTKAKAAPEKKEYIITWFNENTATYELLDNGSCGVSLYTLPEALHELELHLEADGYDLVDNYRVFKVSDVNIKVTPEVTIPGKVEVVK